MIEIKSEVVKVCRNGHAQTDENIGWDRNPSGVQYPRCKPCKRDAVRRVRERQRKGEPPLRSMIIPRQHKTGQSQTPVAQTQSLFALLPDPLRRRLAGLILTAGAPPRFLYILRVASEENVWAKTSEDWAVAMYIEGVARRCMETPGVRADEVLGYLLA